MAEDPKKTVKKGETLFKAGEAVDRIYFVQSGRIEIGVPRKNHNQPLMELAAPLVLGEQALWGNKKHVVTVQALSPLTILEIPVANVQSQVEASSPFLKILLKGFYDQNKQMLGEIKSLNMKGDSAPCPDFVVPKVFYILSVFARYHSEKAKDGRDVLKWRFVRDFSFKVFQEPVKRMESTLVLLKKLGMADLVYKMVKEDENDEKEIATEVLDDIFIHDPVFLESFADFYQTYFYKPEYAQILKIEERITQIVRFLVDATEGLEPSFLGSVRILLGDLVQKAKDEGKTPITSDHLEILKAKGLFCKCSPNEDGEVVVSFDRVEFAKVLSYWEIIVELDKWNQRGQVLLEEPKEAASAAQNSCTSCGKEVATEAKFCPECGHQLKSAA